MILLQTIIMENSYDNSDYMKYKDSTDINTKAESASPIKSPSKLAHDRKKTASAFIGNKPNQLYTGLASSRARGLEISNFKDKIESRLIYKTHKDLTVA